jgi:hypothetical protein
MRIDVRTAAGFALRTGASIESRGGGVTFDAGVESSSGPVVDSGKRGSFDCVRLAPHFAQDDRGYKRVTDVVDGDDRGWKAEIVPQLRNRRGQNRLGRTGEGACAYVGCAEDSAAFLIWGDNGET